MSRFALLTLLGLVPAANAAAPSAATTAAAAVATAVTPARTRIVPLSRAVDAILDRPAFATASWGIEIRDLASGRVLFARDARKSLRPASALKLVTSAAALDILGPTARVTTSVEAAVPIDSQGVVAGDVYLVGRGDPNLSGRFFDGRPTTPFERLAAALVAAGVRRIEGRLVGHEGSFAGARRGPEWPWEDLVWWYGAEVSALSFADNSVELNVRPGVRVGEPVAVERRPASAHYSVTSSAVTSAAGSKRELVLQRELGTNAIQLSGTQPLGDRPAELIVALEDPARYAVGVFAETLAAAGIAVVGPVVTSSEPLPASTVTLASHSGQPLSEELRPVNKQSQNLHAELLLRRLDPAGHHDAKGPRTSPVIADFLSRHKIDSAGWFLADGSGLSPANLVTAHGLVDLLAVMDRHPAAVVFKESLAVAGRDGTLEGRMRGTAAEARVRGKSGGVRHVAALGGYVDSRSGARLAFAIILNNLTAPLAEATKAIDAVCGALASR